MNASDLNTLDRCRLGLDFATTTSDKDCLRRLYSSITKWLLVQCGHGGTARATHS